MKLPRLLKRLGRRARVRDLMTTPVRSCHRNDSLSSAAKLMWDLDFGCLPVISDDSEVIGLVTDRDICMAALTQGRPLSEILVETAMSRHVVCCEPQDGLDALYERMQTHQVRRIVVVEGEQRLLLGIVALSDLARNLAHPARGMRCVSPDDVARVVTSVSQARELEP